MLSLSVHIVFIRNANFFRLLEVSEKILSSIDKTIAGRVSNIWRQKLYFFLISHFSSLTCFMILGTNQEEVEYLLCFDFFSYMSIQIIFVFKDVLLSFKNPTPACNIFFIGKSYARGFQDFSPSTTTKNKIRRQTLVTAARDILYYCLYLFQRLTFSLECLGSIAYLIAIIDYLFLHFKDIHFLTTSINWLTLARKYFSPDLYI